MENMFLAANPCLIQLFPSSLKRYAGNYTVHGLRSSFRQWAAETTQYPRACAGKALGHSSGSQLIDAYQRSDLFEQKKGQCKIYEKCLSGPISTEGWGWIPASLILYLALTRVIHFVSKHNAGNLHKGSCHCQLVYKVAVKRVPVYSEVQLGYVITSQQRWS